MDFYKSMKKIVFPAAFLDFCKNIDIYLFIKNLGNHLGTCHKIFNSSNRLTLSKFSANCIPENFKKSKC